MEVQSLRVTPEDHGVVEDRSKFNGNPSPAARKFITRWAKYNDLVECWSEEY